MTGHHGQRTADHVRRLLAEILRSELRDPRVGFVTLTGVDLSPDLRSARAYVTVMSPQSPLESVRALNHAVPFVRRALAQRAGLRFTPELRFMLDPAAETGQRVDGILERLRRDVDPEDDPQTG